MIGVDDGVDHVTTVVRNVDVGDGCIVVSLHWQRVYNRDATLLPDDVLRTPLTTMVDARKLEHSQCGSFLNRKH